MKYFLLIRNGFGVKEPAMRLVLFVECVGTTMQLSEAVIKRTNPLGYYAM